MTEEKKEITYEVGKTYPFKIRAIHQDFCELVDETGFRVYLQHTNGLRLNKGQEIRCLVTANSQLRPKIELVDAEVYSNDSRLSPEKIDSIIRSIAQNWETKDFTDLLMMNEVEDKSFESECRKWISTLEVQRQDLNRVREDCTKFMEESDFLSLCNDFERDIYQQRLTTLIDLLSYYIEADKLQEEQKGKDFLEGILNKLEKTGYVYHPAKNFNIMSCLLLNDPSLMTSTVTRLFDIIRRWPLEIWIKEPFKSTLIKVLSLYIEENILKVDRQENNEELVNSLIQAITILLLLADNKDNYDSSLPDERLNFSRLCVLSTYQEEYNNHEVLTLALNYLTGSKYFRPFYKLNDTASNKVTFILKTYKPLMQKWPIDTRNSFISGNNRLVISPEGISLFSGNSKEKTVLPENLKLWENLQVYADRRWIRPISGKVTVRDCKNLWDDIEHVFFEQKQSVIHEDHTSAIKEKTRNIGDCVTISITRVEFINENESKAYCIIQGEKEESGYLYGEDIVSYIHHLEPWMFTDDRGKMLNMEAEIKGFDSDGMIHFSMQNTIKRYVSEELYSPGDEVVCSLGKSMERGDHRIPVPAVTPDGESISLAGFCDEDFNVGDLVKATYQNTASGTFHLFCSVEGRATGEPVNLAKAFHNLMLNYAYADDDDTEDTQQPDDKGCTNIANDDFENSDRILDVTYVKEIIRILDRMAFTDDDYVRSYNYLAFARALCRLIGWGTQAAYYRGRLELIYLLYDFAINDHIDPERLDNLQNTSPDLFGADTSMSEKFHQLRIVSYLGYRGHDDELWRCRSMEDGTTQKLSSLVMAYNILRENNMDRQANDVFNRIKDNLNLKGYESNLETYGIGIETDKVEYKESLVYPSGNHMRPELRLRTDNVLEAIASFLNAYGGTVYIGANNSGAGIGVENDLEYKEFNGDRDKYQRYILDQCAIRFGNYATTYIHSKWNIGEKSGKYVLEIDVEPCPEGVSLYGVWYFRQDNGKRSLSKQDFESYNVRRKEKLQRMLTEGASQLNIDKPSENVKDLSKTEPTNGLVNSATKPSSIEKINTSTSRNNSLIDDGSGDYRPSVAFFKFLPNGKFSKISDYDYDESTELSLAVYDEEAQDGNLVLGYDDGTINKVPVRELLRFDDYREYLRFTGAKLLFATIATDDDALISVNKEDNSKGRIMVRVDTLSNIEPGRLQDKGQRLWKEGISKEILAYEIAPVSEQSNLSGILNRSETTLGQPLRTSPKDVKDSLKRCGIL